MLDDLVKESNPKDAIGVLKAPTTTIPKTVMAEIGVGMLEGALKYGRHNYRAIGVRTSVYLDAAMRHLIRFEEGEDIDPDSDLSHIIKAITSLVVLRDAMIQGKCIDDRPPPTANIDEFMDGLNAAVKKMAEKYPSAKQPYTCGDIYGMIEE